MPSFDIVSELDKPELTNAVDQANKELAQRYDFKGSNAIIHLNGQNITLEANDEFQIKQMRPLLYQKMTKRGIDIACIEPQEIKVSGKRAKQELLAKEGIDKETAKKIVKMIKDKKIKVQAAIQGEQLRVSGKKRDDLQAVIAMLKAADLGIPLQFQNFRD